MKAIRGTVLIMGLNLMWRITSTYTAPLVDLNSSWGQSDPTPIFTSACSPIGKCWGWIPLSELPKSVPSLAVKDLDNSRIQIRRQVKDLGSDLPLDPWKVEDGSRMEASVRPSIPLTRQIANRLTKKDVFLSRGWGAGGMPFSVLYMKPHAPRPGQPGTGTGTNQQQEGRKTVDSSTSFERPNYRIALRNGASGQSRRQYSIIPQLFMSYGWGPLGK